MAHDPQSRKCSIIIINPQEAGFDHSHINDQIRLFSPDYYCLSDDFSATGIPHTHIFLLLRCPVRLSSLKKTFPTAYIEKAYVSVKDNRDYLLKEGRWKDSEKAVPSVARMFEEYGVRNYGCYISSNK